jgi:hypothetical protein
VSVVYSFYCDVCHKRVDEEAESLDAAGHLMKCGGWSCAPSVHVAKDVVLYSWTCPKCQREAGAEVKDVIERLKEARADLTAYSHDTSRADLAMSALSRIKWALRDIANCRKEKRTCFEKNNNYRLAESEGRGCLSCGASMSEDGNGGSDILHCIKMPNEDNVVDDSMVCDLRNG